MPEIRNSKTEQIAVEAAVVLVELIISVSTNTFRRAEIVFYSIAIA